MKIAEPEICYGCGACSAICPRHCISMAINQDGELRPSVDLTHCIECGQCTKVCIALAPPALLVPKKTYAMTLTDPGRKKSCASGGAATLLYEQTLKNGGVVFGCSFDSDFVLRMQAAKSLEEAETFKNSKYTFCRMDNTYQEIRGFLQKNIPVLFIGSSCQVYALQKYLGKPHPSLTTVDLVCHGVPPERYFQEYIQKKEKAWNCKIDTVQFRGPTGSKDYRLKAVSKDRILCDVFAREDLYFAGFVNYIMFERKCYSCPFASVKRVSDISIGDWRWPTNIQGHKLSLIFSNTEHGDAMVQKILAREDVLWEEHTPEEACACNEQLRGPSPMPDYYDRLRSCFRKDGFYGMAETYIQPLIQNYQRKQKKEKIIRILSLPRRAAGKLKRMVCHK